MSMLLDKKAFLVGRGGENPEVRKQDAIAIFKGRIGIKEVESHKTSFVKFIYKNSIDREIFDRVEITISNDLA